MDAVRTTEIAPTACPACGEVIEAATGHGTPAPGCVTLCIYCRAILIFTDDLQQRLMSNAEWAALPREQRELITRIREALQSEAWREAHP